MTRPAWPRPGPAVPLGDRVTVTTNGSCHEYAVPPEQRPAFRRWLRTQGAVHGAWPFYEVREKK